MKPNTLNGVLAQVLLSGAAQPDPAAHEEVAKKLRETALVGDFGDDGKPVVVVDTSFERHGELQAALAAAGREDRVVVVGGGLTGRDLQRTRTVHKTTGLGLTAAVAIASMQSISGAVRGGTTGRAMSKRYSDMVKEDNRRRAEQRAAQPRQVTMSRNFAAPYGARPSTTSSASPPPRPSVPARRRRK